MRIKNINYLLYLNIIRTNYYQVFIGTWSGAFNDDGMFVETVGGDGGQSTFKIWNEKATIDIDIEVEAPCKIRSTNGNAHKFCIIMLLLDLLLAPPVKLLWLNFKHHSHERIQFSNSQKLKKKKNSKKKNEIPTHVALTNNHHALSCCSFMPLLIFLYHC